VATDPEEPSMSRPPARSAARRLCDTRAILEGEVDCWVASAGPDGTPHLVPLSFGWQDGVVTMATPAAYRTARNLAARPRVRLAFGDLRDVVIVDGLATVQAVGEVSAEVVDEFSRQAGFDPRHHGGYAFMVVTPQRVLAWRQENELEGRVLMRDGVWIDEEDGS
jgi:hypothetical protein